MYTITTSMEAIKANSIELCEIIKGVPNLDDIDNCIRKYIKSNEDTFQAEYEFPPGLKWFGVSRSLTKKCLEGRIVVLDFFTYCCMNCIHVISQLKRFEERYSNNSVLVIGVHSPKFENEKDEMNLKSAIDKLGINHPVVNDPETILWDKFDISCWPTLLVLGPKCQPLLVLVGEGHHKELELFVDIALKYYASSLSNTQLPFSPRAEAAQERLLSYPNQVTVSVDGLIGVTYQHKVVLLSKTGTVENIIGSNDIGFIDGPFDMAKFNDPQGIVFHGKNKIFVADSGNHAIRLVDFDKKLVTTVVGNGKQGNDLVGGKDGSRQEICSPWGLCICSVETCHLPIASATLCSENILHSPLPPPLGAQASGGPPCPPPPPPSLLLPPARAPCQSAPPPPGLPPPLVTPVIGANPQRAEVLLISMSGSHQIWAYFFEDVVWWKGKKHKKGTCCAVAGTGSEENRNNRYPMSASFAQPSGICCAQDLNALFIADSESSSVRKMCLTTGQVSSVVGGHLAPDNLFSFGDVDGIGTEAKLQHPLDVTWDSLRQKLYVVDTYNHKLKSVDVSKRCCAHVQLPYTLNEPGGICFDGNVVYIADTNNHSLLCWNPDDSSLKTIDVRQRSQAQQNKSLSRHLWETQALVRSDGSEVKLLVKLPHNISGRWQCSAGLEDMVIGRKGPILDGVMEVNLFAKANGELCLDLDLAECRDNACYMSYYRLLVIVKVADNAENCFTLQISPELKS